MDYTSFLDLVTIIMKQVLVSCTLDLWVIGYCDVIRGLWIERREVISYNMEMRLIGSTRPPLQGGQSLCNDEYDTSPSASGQRCVLKRLRHVDADGQTWKDRHSDKRTNLARGEFRAEQPESLKSETSLSRM